MGDKKRLARAGLEVMDRLDLPGELAAGVGRMELVGCHAKWKPRELSVRGSMGLLPKTLLVRLLLCELA